MEPLSAAVETVLRRPFRAGFDWHITGLEHLPEQGAVLLAANHISLFDPVARRSETARASLTAALTHLGWGECVGIFPEGGLSRDLEPRAGQTGAARLARWSGAPVVPVGLWGTQRVTSPGHKTRLRVRG